MSEKRIFLFDARDEELLYRAFARYIAGITEKSVNLTIAMLHSCIQETAEKSGISETDARGVDPSLKREFLENGIDSYLKKLNISYIQHNDIMNGCMTIYDRWAESRFSCDEENEMAEPAFHKAVPDDNTGDEYQELLLKAFSHYISGIPGMGAAEAQTLIRSCVTDITKRHSVNLRDAKRLDEATRRNMIVEGVNDLVERVHLSPDRAEIIMKDILKVYDRWNEKIKGKPE